MRIYGQQNPPWLVAKQAASLAACVRRCLYGTADSCRHIRIDHECDALWRRTSRVKSTWPGVSMMLMQCSFQKQVVAADVIVMPRSRSCAVCSGRDPQVVLCETMMGQSSLYARLTMWSCREDS